MEGSPTTNVLCPRCGADNPAIQPAPAVSPTVRLLAMGGMAIVGLGFGVLFFVQAEPPPDAGQPPPRTSRSARATPKGPWLEVYRDDLCFVDANGDDVRDPVVWMSEGKDRSRVAVIDGRTGQGLWAATAVKGRPPLSCVGKDVIVAGTGEAALRGLDARSGAETWRVDLSGTPEVITVGEGCVSVLARGGAIAGVQGATGAMDRCASAPTPDPFAGPRWERTRNPRLIPAGEVELRLSAAASTEPEPKLTLEGLRGGAPAWTRPLDAQAPGVKPELMMVVSGGLVVVAGAERGGGGRMRFIGVDVGTGAVLYERPAGWAGPNIPAMELEGGRVVVIAGGSLRAIEAMTGEEAWQAVAPSTLL
ncbi:putative serine/threonine protein kinase [Chondromyces apiculatus DSM 436]|uniref:Putative serine/threonine protein kinase n=1 Tax=Chondromyces apiculatus DSM 436 TaxID=1192034 RepID=A0A017TER6_9BACT|nr:putative serine/threonine protein kinase [Chondromyces apiculatus DSM 436]